MIDVDIQFAVERMTRDFLRRVVRELDERLERQGIVTRRVAAARRAVEQVFGDEAPDGERGAA